MDDVARIESHIDNVDRVSPSILRSLPLRREHRILEQVVVHAVVGPPHRTRTIGDAVWDVELGVALTSDDNEHRRQVIVIGPTVREALFDPDEDPLGAYVLVGQVPFGVKGVLGPFPTADLYGPDLFEDEEWLAGLGAVAYLAAPAIADHLDLPLAIPPWAVPAALTTSLAVGAVFGTVPAWRAARVDPMASLTTEWAVGLRVPPIVSPERLDGVA